MQEAIAFYRLLIRQHHAAMLAAKVETAMRLRKHVDLLAHVLERETAAAPGEVPRWGRTGEFIITVDCMKVRIELEGIFGIGSGR